MKRLLISTAALVSLAMLAQCASISITATWKDSAYTTGPFKKIVVMALFNNLETRQAVETGMVAELKRHGNDAAPSLDFMAPNQKYAHAQIEKLLEKNGIDGILIIKLMGISKKQKYHPGSNYFQPNFYYDMYNEYYVMYSMRRDPGYIDEKDYVKIRASLFANSTDRMVWRAEMTAVEDYQTKEGLTNPKTEAPVLAKLVHANLVANGLAKR